MTNKAVTYQEPIAVVGMAATMPGANDLDEFWANLRAGRESITFGPTPVVDDERTGRRWIHARGVLADIRRFDYEFFGIPRREAEILDPQHRLLLEHAWSAMEEAGYDPHRLTETVAVYTAVGPNTYREGREFGAHSAAERLLVDLSNAPDTLSTRISYKLGLTGESLSVRTACSSSMVAVYLAAEAVRTGRAGIALAGAANVRCHDTLAYEQQDGFILSADGHTRAYDHRGTGYVEGDGVGVVVLRRLSDAIADGDHIHAVILSGAINNDGKAKIGFSAPGVEGQSAAISAALAASGVPAESIHMLEGHGTGTAVGDPIEVRALTKAYRRYTGESGFCALGSVKANIGHLGYASGMAGLLKAILAVKHGEIPPAPDFDEPNPEIDFVDSPFHVNRTPLPWPPGPRRAGVSNFGMGGTNVHLIVEQPPEPQAARHEPAEHAVLLSARTEGALRAMRKRLLAWLTGQPDADLADVAFTLATGRTPLPCRWAAVVSSTVELANALTREADPREDELARAWLDGTTVDWARRYAGRRHRRLSLPTYPWQGEELWVPVTGHDTGHDTGPGTVTEPGTQEQQPIERWLYRQTWTRTALPRPHHYGDLERTDGACLVLGGDSRLTAAVRAQLTAAGLTVVPVELSDEFDVVPGGVVRVRQGDAADLARLVEHAVTEAGPITRVVHLWAYGVTGDQAMSVGVLGTLALVQALTAAGQSPRLWVLTQNAQPVGDVTTVCPEAAALLGLGQVVAQEYPGVPCQGIDFAAGATPAGVAARLLAEMATPPQAPEIAYRGADRYEPAFEQLDTVGGAVMPVRPDGVYLIAGGSGRMGLAIAEHLAASGATRIALVSRRGPAPGNETLRRLGERGAEVLTLRADVADEPRMAQVIEEVNRHWGPVNGVVHAAGIEAGGSGFTFIADTTADHARDMLRPKTTGIAVLDRVTRTQPLDFCLVCSSLSAVLGGITFGVYTAANRYLDAYADWRRANGAPWVSVDWDVWRFGDSPADSGAGLGVSSSRTAMSLGQATGLLGSIMAGGHSRLVVSTVPLAERAERVRRLLGGRESVEESGAQQAGTSQDDLCGHLKQIVGDLVGVADLDDDDELLAIGCDSLTFLEALKRWESRIRVKVPITRLWGCRTFAELAEAGSRVVGEQRAIERDAGRQSLRHLGG
ncbi:SDR family NAD(P)-dependent oxidoreductase [Kibdelosporangium persicum]|uniref:Phosphopantetheine attachment site n=1 Tax=Kibdelosporangium persicum TaxID=2698649 RepID=A0ABX2FHP6_9PSEU|nr:SDR family NAD(P)-dependent oxidoreductase [Kibdelosporangium persicum]NRN70385.1 Phosphopantetheine attachment site [Kibdelosporangium persicum]